ncbi:MAG: hypothetical protein F4Y21_01090, partial [Gemmatimonadetes bacterium]|nr:hypothetical protein [Gemmatimonadota bacterium]
MIARPPTAPRLTATILIAALCGFGCEDLGDRAPDGPRVAVRDSGGVTIVDNDPAAPDSRLPWRFGEQPSLSIGSVDSGEADELFRVQDATLLADGRIMIANAGSSEIKVFHTDGSHSGTWGRQGEGPGEFSSGPDGVALWLADSIAVPGGRRVSLFDLDGNHGRDVALDATRSNVLDLLPDGRIVSMGSLLLNRRTMGSPDLVQYDTEWSVLDTDGAPHASLGEFLATEEWVWSFPDGSTGENPYPFRRDTRGAVWGNLVAIGAQDSYEIRAFAADGSLVRIVRRDWDPRSPTQADLEEHVARAYAHLPPEARSRALTMFKDMPLTDSYPAFEEIVGDRAGYLWVREYRMFGEGDAVWTVFDPEGRIQGLVETPPGLTVFEIGEDYVLGLGEDELGVEYVQVWG